MIDSYGLSDVGLVRKQNQDRILIDESVGLFVVADGMGGHTHGELAAQVALSSIQFYIDSSCDRSFDVSWPFRVQLRSLDRRQTHHHRHSVGQQAGPGSRPASSQARKAWVRLSRQSW